MAFALLSLTWPPVSLDELAAAVCGEGVGAVEGLLDALRASRPLIASLRGLRVAVSACTPAGSASTGSDTDGLKHVVLRLPMRAGGGIAVAVRPYVDDDAIDAGKVVAVKLIEVAIVQTIELLADFSTPAKSRSASTVSTICSAGGTSGAVSGGSSRDSTPPKGADGHLDILDQTSIAGASTASSVRAASVGGGPPAATVVTVAFAAGERVEAVLKRALASAALVNGKHPTPALHDAASIFPHAEVAAWDPAAAAAAATAPSDSDDLSGIAVPALLSMSDCVPRTATRLQFTARPPPRAASPLWSSRTGAGVFSAIDVSGHSDSTLFGPGAGATELHALTAPRGDETTVTRDLRRSDAPGSRFTAAAAAAASIFIPASMAPHQRMVTELQTHLSAVVDAWRAAGESCMLSTGYSDADASMDLVHKKLPPAALPALEALEACAHEMNMCTNGSKGGRGAGLRELEGWRRDLVHAGAIPALIDIIRIIPDSDASRKVLEYTVQTITNIGFDNESRSRMIHAPLQLVQVLVNRMGADSDTAEMQLKAARCLTALCFENSEAVSQVIRAGGVERALAAISTHHSHTFTVCKCMELLDVIREGEGFVQRLRAVAGAAEVIQRECLRADRGYRHPQLASRIASMMPDLTTAAAAAGGGSGGATSGAGAFHFDAREPAASRSGRGSDDAPAWRGHGGRSRGGRGSHRAPGHDSSGRRGGGFGGGKW